MPRLRLLAPLLAAPLACSPGGETSSTTSPFESGPATTGGPGPSSFGDSTSASSGEPTTTTGEPTTPTGGPTTELPSTGDASTTADTLTLTTTTGEPDSSTSGGPAVCGNGVLEADEFCDDGNNSDGDACLSDCHAGAAVLALVGVGTKPAITLLFDPELGWSSQPASIGVAAAALVATPDGAMAAARRSSAVPDEDGELFHARWSDQEPALFTMFTKVGAFGFAKDGPSLASVPDTVTLTFLGTDNKHYSALHSDETWAPFAKIPAGMVDVQAFGPSASVAVPGMVETYVAYTGDDARIYYTSKSSPGGAWAASQATPPPAVLGSPVGLVDEAGDLVLAYVRKSDGQLALIKLITPMNAWTKETLVHPTAITGGAISLARADDGRYALAWRGFDTQGLYLATAAALDSWDTPQPIEVPQATSTPPQLVPGVLGADLEILYTVGGELRHARLDGDELIAPVDVPGVTGGTTVAAARVQLEPG